MQAVFRADASAALGGGHAMRCLSVAGFLKTLGWHCGFAVNEAALKTVPGLASEDLEILNCSAMEEPEALKKLWAGGVDWLIADHYSRDADWEKSCRGWAGKILVIDDLADRRHDCDVLLDQTLGVDCGDYARLVPPDAQLLTGSEYALLRPSFAAARPTSLDRRRRSGKLERILVSLGATDPGNHSFMALQAIAKSGLPLTVDVVLGSAAQHRGAVAAEIESMHQDVELHIEATNLPELMTHADLAIGAAGTSTWERCCLGLPSLMLVVAENQRRIAARVAAAGAARLVSAGPDSLVDEIAAALIGLSDDGAALADMSAKAAAICDGRGGDRLGLALTAPGRTKDGRQVSLRLAASEDESLILEWQRHPTTRRFSRNPEVPSPEEHHRWFSARLAEPECLFTLITMEGTPTGVLRLDPVPRRTEAPEAPAYEVSILISPDYRGQGIAEEALRFARRWQGKAIIVAEVLPGNEASGRLFRNAEYKPGAEGKLYSYPEDGGITHSHQDR